MWKRKLVGRHWMAGKSTALFDTVHSIWKKMKEWCAMCVLCTSENAIHEQTCFCCSAFINSEIMLIWREKKYFFLTCRWVNRLYGTQFLARDDIEPKQQYLQTVAEYSKLMYDEFYMTFMMLSLKSHKIKTQAYRIEVHSSKHADQMEFLVIILCLLPPLEISNNQQILIIFLMGNQRDFCLVYRKNRFTCKFWVSSKSSFN